MANVKFTRAVVVDGTPYRSSDVCEVSEIAEGTLASLLYVGACVPVDGSPSEVEPLPQPEPEPEPVASLVIALEDVPDISPHLLAILAEQQITTIADLDLWLDRHESLSEISGIGRKTAQQVIDAIASFEEKLLTTGDQ